MKKINIKGKEYVPIHERILHFRDAFKGWTLLSENLTPDDPERAQFRAWITNDLGQVVATGHAEEKAGSSFINNMSHVENAETSAWGRALACLGIGIDTGIASFEEVGNAIKNDKTSKYPDL